MQWHLLKTMQILPTWKCVLKKICDVFRDGLAIGGNALRALCSVEIYTQNIAAILNNPNTNLNFPKA
jgi:hypothetical protein